MSQAPIEGVQGVSGEKNDDAIIEARSNEPGAFTGYFDEGLAKVVGNGEMSIDQWTAHAIQVSAKDLNSDHLAEMADQPGFVEAASQHAISLRPQNAHLKGRKTDEALESGELYYTSFGHAIKELSELYKKNPDGFTSMLQPSASLGSTGGVDVQSGHKHATGQIHSVGLPLPTRVPGDT